MRIGELAHRTGLSAHTIRYYERIGLLPVADRDASGQRIYDRTILAWIAFLGRLKVTGMPIRDQKRYASLRQGGAETQKERLTLLTQHRDRVRARMADLSAALSVLDAKIDSYKNEPEKDYIHGANTP